MYREFYKPIQIETPDYSPIAQGLTNLANNIETQRKQRLDADNQYDFALEYGQWENDNLLFEEAVKNVTKQAREYYRNPTKAAKKGITLDSIVAQEEHWKRRNTNSKKQAEKFKALNDSIDKKAAGPEKNYWDTDFYHQIAKEAVIGDGTITDENRGARLDEISENLFNDPRAFKIRGFTDDYVKSLGKKNISTSREGTSSKRAEQVETPFLDPKTGSYDITDNHLMDYFNSHEMVKKSHELNVKNQIAQEAAQIKKMANQGDERLAKFKNMDEAEIMLSLQDNSNDNVINKSSFKDRVKESARNELKQVADFQRKTDVEYKDPKVVNHVNNDQRNEDTFYNNAIGEGETTRLSSPGGTLMQKNGKPLQIQSDSEASYDLRTGKRSKRRGESLFNLTGYQLVPMKKDGSIAFVSGGSTDELIANLDKMSDEEVANLNPNLQVGFRGYSIDRNNAINDVNTKKSTLETQLGEATENGETDKVQKITAQLQNLEKLKSDLGVDDVSDDDLISSMRRNNIKANSVRYDELLMPSLADYKKVKSVTTASDGSGGLNLSNRNQWTSDMLRYESAFKKRYNEAVDRLGKGTGTADIINAKGGGKQRQGGQNPVTPIESDGTDLDSWSPSKTYKVGKNTYFYDKASSQWQRK